ncbi:MAG TPA: helix-turn-helix domain-containing protein [Gaiellaceae bacterium]|nr:helix-turn-helix domain-containing protein [Gaiellaceae bacterium]
MAATSAPAHEPPRRSPRRRPSRGERRRQLLALAAHALAQHGYLGTTLQQVARRAGISEAAIYRHFASKEALLRAAVAEAPNALLERWRLIRAVAPASDWLETMGQQYERELDEGSWSLALQLQAASHSQAMRELVRVDSARVHDFVRQTALAAQAAGAQGRRIDADAVATEFLAAPIRRRVERTLGIAKA